MLSVSYDLFNVLDGANENEFDEYIDWWLEANKPYIYEYDKIK